MDFFLSGKFMININKLQADFRPEKNRNSIKADLYY